MGKELIIVVEITAILTGVVVGLVLALILGSWLRVQRRAQRAWLRRRPVDFSVDRLPHILADMTISDAPPLVPATVTRVVREPWAVALEGSLPDPRGLEASKPATNEVHEWLRSHGGVDFRETKLRLSLSSRTDELVIVRNIGVRVERSEPWADTYVYCPTAGANAATLLLFELDDPTPQARQWKEDGFRRRVGFSPFFAHHNVTIKKDDVHDFIVIGRAERCFARWRMVVELEVGGHRKTLEVGDGTDWFKTSGEPVSGFATRLHWAWYAGGHFLPEPEGDL
jgi:hypothetical protein